MRFVRQNWKTVRLTPPHMRTVDRELYMRYVMCLRYEENQDAKTKDCKRGNHGRTDASALCGRLTMCGPRHNGPRRAGECCGQCIDHHCNGNAGTKEMDVNGVNCYKNTR